MPVRLLPAGDRGLVVEFENVVSLEVNARVRTLALALESARPPGLVEVVPTYRSLGIQFDPVATSLPALQAQVEGLLTRLNPAALPPPRLVELPTVYGGAYGPDLPFVSEHAGLSQAEVIRLHSEATYHVYMLGFSAGFAYLGGLPEPLHTPRLPAPRTRTPKGSVAIGGSQTGAYPADTPGGWRIIGRTYIELFDPWRDPPTPMQPGDHVRFVPIGEVEYLRAAKGRQSDTAAIGPWGNGCPSETRGPGERARGGTPPGTGREMLSASRRLISRLLENALLARLLKQVQMQGGAPGTRPPGWPPIRMGTRCEAYLVRTPQRRASAPGADPEDGRPIPRMGTPPVGLFQQPVMARWTPLRWCSPDC
jgi:KipI family sensor histidine kinase inhibitor